LLKQSVAALKGEKVKPRVEVQVRFDFLALSPGEESERVQSSKAKVQNLPEFEINVPREVANYIAEPEVDTEKEDENKKTRSKASAFIPLAYIAEAKQRIEIYRKLAQATEKSGLERLEVELRDRFGQLPAAMELLLLVGEIRILASEKGITVIEVKEDKLMLTRNNDFIMLGGKFPRLTKKEARARLKEIKRLLLAL